MLEDKTRSLIMCADQDGEGSIPYKKTVEKATQSLKEEGFTVFVIRPDASLDREDFNDVLKREGVQDIKRYFAEHLDPIKTMSGREQRIFFYLEKAISDDPYTRGEAKEDYLEKARKNPEDILAF